MQTLEEKMKKLAARIGAGDHVPGHEPCYEEAEPQTAWDGVERRKHPRREIGVPIRVGTMDGASFEFEAHTVNISLGGVGFRFPAPMEIHSTVRLELDLGDCEINCTGMVVRSRPVVGAYEGLYDIGVQFDLIQPEDLDRLQCFLIESLALEL